MIFLLQSKKRRRRRGGFPEISWQWSREKMDRHIHLCIYIYTYTNISNKWSELEVTGQRAAKGLEKQSTGVSKMAYAKGRSKEGVRKPQGWQFQSCHQEAHQLSHSPGGGTGLRIIQWHLPA